jgi:hypothetical protein
MALSILDGNQSATTLSTILSSGQHITAHTVVSLGTQAITDMQSAVSGSVVSIPSLPAISGTVTIGTALPAGTNRIGVVTIGGGTVTLGLGSQRIGSVTALGSRVNYATEIAIPVGLQGDTGFGYGYNDNAFIPIRIISNQTGTGIDLVGNETGGKLPISGSVTIGAGTAQIGSVTASISGTVTANTFALQGTAVTTSNFTSTTASTVLANFNATREVLTIFNEGAGNLHICAGATCTTIAYQVRLSAGDYYEVPNHQTTITHSAVFATAGTARVCQVS